MCHGVVRTTEWAQRFPALLSGAIERRQIFALCDERSVHCAIFSPMGSAFEFRATFHALERAQPWWQFLLHWSDWTLLDRNTLPHMQRQGAAPHRFKKSEALAGSTGRRDRFYFHLESEEIRRRPDFATASIIALPAVLYARKFQPQRP
jgi:hypothetical protein